VEAKKGNARGSCLKEKMTFLKRTFLKGVEGFHVSTGSRGSYVVLLKGTWVAGIKLYIRTMGFAKSRCWRGKNTAKIWGRRIIRAPGQKKKPIARERGLKNKVPGKGHTMAGFLVKEI